MSNIDVYNDEVIIFEKSLSVPAKTIAVCRLANMIQNIAWWFNKWSAQNSTIRVIYGFSYQLFENKMKLEYSKNVLIDLEIHIIDV